MSPFLRLRQCNNRRWQIRRWHAGQEPTRWRERPAYAGATLRASRWQLVVAALGRGDA